MLPVGFKPATPGSDRLQTLALDRSAIGIGDMGYERINTTYFDKLLNLFLCYDKKKALLY